MTSFEISIFFSWFWSLVRQRIAKKVGQEEGTYHGKAKDKDRMTLPEDLRIEEVVISRSQFVIKRK